MYASVRWSPVCESDSKAYLAYLDTVKDYNARVAVRFERQPCCGGVPFGCGGACGSRYCLRTLVGGEGCDRVDVVSGVAQWADAGGTGCETLAGCRGGSSGAPDGEFVGDECVASDGTGAGASENRGTASGASSPGGLREARDACARDDVSCRRQGLGSTADRGALCFDGRRVDVCSDGGDEQVRHRVDVGRPVGKCYRKNKKRRERAKVERSLARVSVVEQGRMDAEAALAQRKAELALARLSDPTYTAAHDIMLKRKMLAGTQAAVAKTEMWLSKTTSVSPSSSVSEAELRREREEREKSDRILANVSSVVASMPGDAFVDRNDRKKLVVALSEDPADDEAYQCIEIDVEPAVDTRPIDVRFEDKVNNSWRNVPSKESRDSVVGGIGRDNSIEAMNKRMADARLLFSGGVIS